MYDIERVKEIIKNKENIDLSFYRDTYLFRRIRVRIRKSKSKDFIDYLKKIEADEKERKELINEIGINVSYFFRNYDTFERIREIILPELKKVRKPLIWSAGCASGEEPYSLSMLFLEENIYNYRIVATDFDTKSLEDAREGEYTRDKFQEIPLEYINKYFVQMGDKYKIKEHVKKNVFFMTHNLTDEPPFKNFDMVVCRNVIIYFVREKQFKILENIYNSLKKEGFLVLGRTEFIPFNFMRKFLCIDRSHRIFKKI